MRVTVEAEEWVDVDDEGGVVEGEVVEDLDGKVADVRAEVAVRREG